MDACIDSVATYLMATTLISYPLHTSEFYNFTHMYVV